MHQSFQKDNIPNMNYIFTGKPKWVRNAHYLVIYNMLLQKLCKTKVIRLLPTEKIKDYARIRSGKVDASNILKVYYSKVISILSKYNQGKITQGN